MPLSRDEVSAVLEPYFDKLHRCATAGISQYNERYPNRPIHRSRTRATIAHDLMIDAARREFDGIKGVRVIDLPDKQLTVLDFHEKVIVHFKKLGRGRTPRSYPTKHALTLLEGTPDLPGISPAATLVLVGYTLSLEETRVSRVSIVKPKGTRVPEWFIDLEKPESMTSPVSDSFLKDEIPERRIQVKKGEIQEKLVADEDELQPSDAYSRTRVTRAKPK